MKVGNPTLFNFSFTTLSHVLSLQSKHLQRWQEKEIMLKKHIFFSLLPITNPTISIILSLSQTTNLGSLKLNESADDNFKFDENDKKFSKWVENTGPEKEKLLVTSNFPFPSVFKRRIL